MLLSSLPLPLLLLLLLFPGNISISLFSGPIFSHLFITHSKRMSGRLIKQREERQHLEDVGEQLVHVWKDEKALRDLFVEPWLAVERDSLL